MERPTLSHRELWTMLGISERTFYTRLREGRYDHLRSDEPRKFSRLKVQRHIDGHQPVRGLRAVS